AQTRLCGRRRDGPPPPLSVWASSTAPHGPITQIGQKYRNAPADRQVISQMVVTMTAVLSQLPHTARRQGPAAHAPPQGAGPHGPVAAGCGAGRVAGRDDGRSW